MQDSVTSTGKCWPLGQKTRSQKLYIDQGLSSRKIAFIYKCAYSYIDKKIRDYGFPIKTLAAAHIVTQRRNFGGSRKDKAYLIGFRIGDLRVRKMYKNSESILIDCASTHPEQISLIKSLFEKYGRIWISKRLASGKVQIECGVNSSFTFLLEKFEQFPQWTLKTWPLFWSILAGFIDAEGSFFLSRKRGASGFSIGNYSLSILLQIRGRLHGAGYMTNLALGSRKGYVGKEGYSQSRDYWILSIHRKLELLRFTSTILPYLKHHEKITNAKKVISNIEERNILYGQ